MPTNKEGHFYYSWYPTIYKTFTQDLTLAEDGAYRRLIDHYMETKAPLPDNDRALSRIIGVGLDEWLSIKPQIITHFKPTGLFLHHTFCDNELAIHASRIGKAKTNGKKGGRPSNSNKSEITHSVSETKPNGKLNITEHNITDKEITNYPSGETPNPKAICGLNLEAYDLKDFMICFEVVCLLFDVKKLSLKDQETLSKWFETYDMAKYCLPMVQAGIAKYREKNQGRAPRSLSYFDVMLEKNQPFISPVKELANNLKR